MPEANNYENTFVAVMITSSDVTRDDFSFALRDDMFEQPLRKKGSHARMHLVTLYLDEDRNGVRLNRMKAKPFDELMKSIGELVFGYSMSKINM